MRGLSLEFDCRNTTSGIWVERVGARASGVTAHTSSYNAIYILEKTYSLHYNRYKPSITIVSI